MDYLLFRANNYCSVSGFSSYPWSDAMKAHYLTYMHIWIVNEKQQTKKSRWCEQGNKKQYTPPLSLVRDFSFNVMEMKKLCPLEHKLISPGER